MKDDLIGRLIEMVQQLQPSFTDESAVVLEAQLRHEFGGERVKICKSGLRGEALRAEIRARWNGRNAEEVAAELAVSRATVYRAIRYRRAG